MKILEKGLNMLSIAIIVLLFVGVGVLFSKDRPTGISNIERGAYVITVFGLLFLAISLWRLRQLELSHEVSLSTIQELERSNTVALSTINRLERSFALERLQKLLRGEEIPLDSYDNAMLVKVAREEKLPDTIVAKIADPHRYKAKFDTNGIPSISIPLR